MEDNTEPVLNIFIYLFSVYVMYIHEYNVYFNKNVNF